MASEQDGKITTSSKFSATDMIKLDENWWTICSFPLDHVSDYFLIYASYGVDHKTVSSSSMWLAGGRKGAIQEYFFVWWHKDEWSIVLLSGKKKSQLNSAISWRNY